TPPGLLIARVMSLCGSSSASNISCEQTRLALASSTWVPRNTMRLRMSRDASWSSKAPSVPSAEATGVDMVVMVLSFRRPRRPGRFLSSLLWEGRQNPRFRPGADLRRAEPQYRPLAPGRAVPGLGPDAGRKGPLMLLSIQVNKSVKPRARLLRCRPAPHADHGGA